jgi:hypothetical protein
MYMPFWIIVAHVCIAVGIVGLILGQTVFFWWPDRPPKRKKKSDMEEAIDDIQSYVPGDDRHRGKR